MALLGFQYEPVSFDVNEVYFVEGQDIPNMGEKSRKSQSVIEWCRFGNWDIMHTNLDYLSCCSEVKTLRFDLSFYYRIWNMMLGMCLPKELVQQSCNFTKFEHLHKL